MQTMIGAATAAAGHDKGFRRKGYRKAAVMPDSASGVNRYPESLPKPGLFPISSVSTTHSAKATQLKTAIAYLEDIVGDSTCRVQHPRC